MKAKEVSGARLKAWLIATDKFFAELGSQNQKILQSNNEFQKWVESDNQRFARIQKILPSEQAGKKYLETGDQRILNNINVQSVIKMINEFMNQQRVTPLPSPKPKPILIPKPTPITKPILIPKPTPITKPKPSNTRSPAQKIANALAKLPREKNVDTRVKQLRKTRVAAPSNSVIRQAPVGLEVSIPKPARPTINQIAKEASTIRKPTKQSIERNIKAGRRPMLGSLRSTTASGTSTSTSRDPRAKHRDDESGLGASTSTTTSTRTSGAYRFQDPRFHHRWD